MSFLIGFKVKAYVAKICTSASFYINNKKLFTHHELKWLSHIKMMDLLLVIALHSDIFISRDCSNFLLMSLQILGVHA